MKPYTKLIELQSGKRVLLPLASFSILKGLSQSFISSPAGTYGGFLATTDLDSHEQVVIQKYLLSIRPLILIENPYNKLLQRFEGFTSEDFTQVIDLELSLDELVSRMNKSQIPRKVRQAQKNNLVLQKINVENIDDYYKLYQARRAQWERPTNNYPKQLFVDLFQCPECDFWGVFDEFGELICAGPFLKKHHHVVSWLAIANTEHLKKKPYEFLYFHLITHYKELGYKWLDFNPSGGHEGVVKFKQGFGARKLKIQVFSSDGPIYRLVKNLKNLVSN